MRTRGARAPLVLAAALALLLSTVALGRDVLWEGEGAPGQDAAALDEGGDEAGQGEADVGGVASEMVENLVEEFVGEEGVGDVGVVLGAADTSVYESERSLADEGAIVLDEYRGRGDCVIAQMGYVDLLGTTWGCVLQGEGWADICLLQEAEDGCGCTVLVLHLDAEEVAAAVGCQ